MRESLSCTEQILQNRQPTLEKRKGTSLQDGASISFQQKALRELNSMGLKFVLLREPSSWEDAGDIDILVPDIIHAEPKLIALGYIRFSQEAFNRKYIRYAAEAGLWIHLDVQSTVFFGLQQAPDEFINYLMKNLIYGLDGIPRICDADEAVLLLFHEALDKGHFNQNYIERITRCDYKSLVSQAKHYSFLPDPLELYLKLFLDYQAGNIDEQTAIRGIRAHFNLAPHINSNIMRRIWWRVRGLLKGNRAIVFLGPDGAGKSTLTEPLARLKWPPIRRQFMGPMREDDMRKTFYTSMKYFSGVRDSYPKTNPIGILVRVAWQIICYFDLLDRLFRHTYFWGSDGIVIFDRYACDMYFRKPTFFNELIFIKLFPRPLFVFLCVGDAGAIYKRKPEEISEQTILYTIELYRLKLLKYKIPLLEINTTQYNSKENLQQVLLHLIEHSWFKYGTIY